MKCKVRGTFRRYRISTFLVYTKWLVIFGIVLAGCRKDKEPGHGHGGSDRDAVDIKLIADGLVSPLGVVDAPDFSKRLFIIDQVGKIRIVDGEGNLLPTPFLDLTSKLVQINPDFDERGLLGLAFHPFYSANGKFYVYYSAPPRAGGPEPGTPWDNLIRLSEFKVSGSDKNMADINSERVLLELDDPQFNHNAGTLAFGPDGYLYISIGDGGGADDVGPGHVEDWYTVNAGGNGQDIEANLFGNILRIDVNTGDPYGIPSDNPFVGLPGKDEIYAYGLRNPYRFSIDMGGSHDIIAGDAGQVLYEEVNLIKKGGNYGWNVKEGDICFNAADNLHPLASCPTEDNFGNPLLDPVIAINNWQNPEGGKATTVIGGNVYRGRQIDGLEGKYIFGTFSQSFSAADGELFVANRSGDKWSYEELELVSHPGDIGYYIKGFGQDTRGEVYVTVSGLVGPSGTTGKVFKLVAVKDDDDGDDDDDDDDGDGHGGSGHD